MRYVINKIALLFTKIIELEFKNCIRLLSIQRCFQFSSTVASYLKYTASSHTLHLDWNKIAQIRRALSKNLGNFIARHLKTDCISTSRWNLEFSDFIASFLKMPVVYVASTPRYLQTLFNRFIENWSYTEKYSSVRQVRTPRPRKPFCNMCYINLR